MGRPKGTGIPSGDGGGGSASDPTSGGGGSASDPTSGGGGSASDPTSGGGGSASGGSGGEASSAGSAAGEEVPGHGDLGQFILEAGCNCLNESDEHNHKNVLKENNEYLESDCDEQLMLSISFNQSVKVHSLKIRAPNDGSGPKTIKLFVNQPNEVDFDAGERMEGVQELVLDKLDISGEKIIPLRFVKFQNVTNIVLFVVDNQGGSDNNEVTIINYIKLIGVPCNATDMSDFKRVSGKAGESHMG